MKKSKIQVTLSKTADGGNRWQIWDADIMSAQYFGYVEGYATKVDAQAWIRSANLNSVDTIYKEVSHYY